MDLFGPTRLGIEHATGSGAMSIERTENTIIPAIVNPAHLVMPQRMIVPMPKRFEAAPGIMPFHRMLEAQNLVPKPTPAPNPTHTSEAPAITRPRDTYQPSGNEAKLLPTLGEVLPVTPTTPPAIKIEQTRQVQLPATGRLLDLYL